MPASSEPDREPAGPEVAERSVVLDDDLHARPAGRVARAATRHRETTIELVTGSPESGETTTGERRANARSVLAVMGLGAVTGSRVRVVVTGPGAEAVADEVAGLLS